jgi:hypothetical protein
MPKPDNWIVLIPEAPEFVPSPASQQQARQRLSEIVPEAGEVKVIIMKNIEFFSCCENLECIACPSCRAEVSFDWWLDRMDHDYDKDNGFKLAECTLPCCGAAHTLHELTYTLPQGFGRFALDAKNPHQGLLDDRFKRELEEILGTQLRVIYKQM